MKISTHLHMSLLTEKLDCFGSFELTYIMVDHQNTVEILSSLPYYARGNSNFSFSDRFFHFLKILPENSSQFYSEKSDIFKLSPFIKPNYYVAFVKKTSTKKIKLYLFHSHQRSDVVHLLLHKEVLKRMALYIDECLCLSVQSKAYEDYSILFYNHNKANHLPTSKNDYIQETLEILLTKKEKALVSDFLKYRSVSQVTQHVSFSRSYVSQLLLSAAHKLGLEQVNDILTFDTTTDVLLPVSEKRTVCQDIV